MYEKIRNLPLSKLIAILFSLYVCILITIDTLTEHHITENSMELLKILFPVAVGGYMTKSAYEHKVDKSAGGKNVNNQ